MVRTPNGPRTLFSVIEKANGELVITLKTGGYFGSPPQPGSRVIEQRYSIHTSPKSPDYNVMKLTINMADGRSVRLAALTDAVKKRNGFSILLVRRCEDLSRLDEATCYPNKERILTLAEYDPARDNFYYGIFVGHPDTVFDTTDPGLSFNKFSFASFNIVVACSFVELPSYHTTDIVHSLTSPPESHPEGEDVARFLMTGRTPQICLAQYNNAKRLLARRFIEFVLEHEKLEPETVKMLESDLEQIGGVELIDLGLGHWLGNAEISNPLSERLHGQFLRLKA